MKRFYRLSHLCTFVVKAKVVQHCHPFGGLFRPPYAPPPLFIMFNPPMHVKLLLECKVSKCLQIFCHMAILCLDIDQSFQICKICYHCKGSLIEHHFLIFITSIIPTL